MEDKAGFVCREWVFARLAKCLRYSAGSVSGILLVGGPGSGKSAVCRQLVAPGRSLHECLFFSHFLSCRHSPDDQLEDVAEALAARLRRFLGKELQEEPGEDSPGQEVQEEPGEDSPAQEVQEEPGEDLLEHEVQAEPGVDSPGPELQDEPEEDSPGQEVQEKLGEDSPGQCERLRRLLGQDSSGEDSVALCERLLTRLKSSACSERCCFLLVDGLHRDESGKVAQFLSSTRKLLPPWLIPVISTRRHSDTIKLFRGFRKIVLDDTNKSVVLEDLQQYVIFRVQQDSSLNELIHKIDKNSLRKLQIKSNGSLLYIDKVLTCLSSGFLSVENIDDIPVTLFGLYLWICQKAFTKKHFHKARPVLNILIASLLPLPDRVLFQCMCLRNAAVVRQDFDRRLLVLTHLISGGEGGWTLFHDSCKQWLTEVKYCTSSFLCDRREGDRVLACWMLRNGGQLSSTQVDGLMAHLPELFAVRARDVPLLGDLGDAAWTDSYHLLLMLLWAGVRTHVNFRPEPAGGVVCQLTFARSDGKLEGRILAEHVMAKQQLSSPDSNKANNEKSELAADTLEDLHSVEWWPESEDPLLKCDEVMERSVENTDRSCEGVLCSSADGSSAGSLHGESVSDGDGCKCLLGENGEDGGAEVSRSSSCVGSGLADKTGAGCHAGVSQEANGEHLSTKPVSDKDGAVSSQVAFGDSRDCVLNANYRGSAESVEVVVEGLDVEGHALLSTVLRSAETAEAGGEGQDLLSAVLRSTESAGPGEEGHDLLSAVLSGQVEVLRQLVRRGAPVEVEDGRGCSAVTLAVMSASLEVLHVLLEAGADANHRDRVGVTPLLIAAFEGKVEVCELLLRFGADADHKDSLGRCALFAAASMGHAGVIRLLARWGCYLSVIDGRGRTALCLAAAHGAVSAVTALLDCGLDEMHRDNSGSTPLHHAAGEGRRQAVQALLSFGAAANEVDNKGRHALLVAVAEGHLSTASLLLAFDSDPNLCGHDGRSALRVAAFSEHVPLVELLVASGADVSLRDREGRSILYFLVLHCRLHMAVLLMALGCDLEAADLQGRSALHVSCWQGHEALVLKLLGSGADADAEDADGCTPLISAAWQGHARVLSLLLVHGARVDHACTQGATALCIAAQEGFLQCVGLLLEHGADPNHRDAAGRSAVRVALRGRHRRVVGLLRQFGALLSPEDSAALSCLQEGDGSCFQDSKALHLPSYSNTKHCRKSELPDQRVS